MEDNRQQSNKSEINMSTMNPVQFINTKYKDYTLYEINDELAKLSTEIKETKKKLQLLVPNNFTNFVDCRVMLDNIKVDYLKHNLIEQRDLDESSKILYKKYLNLIETSHLNIAAPKDNILLEYKTKYAKLYDLKYALKQNLFNFENFIIILREARILFEEVKEFTFFQKKMEEAGPEIRDYLKNLYETIVDKNTTFEECCKLFDYYFETSNLKISSGIIESKIMNTLLVNFKDTTYNRKEESDIYYTYLIQSLDKILKYIADEQLIESIHHFFKCFKEVLSNTTPEYCCMIIKRIKDYQKTIKAKPYALKEFKDSFYQFNVSMFEHFASQIDLNKIPNLFICHEG